MERIYGKLRISQNLIDILDGIRSFPSAQSEHEVLVNTIRNISDEIKSIQTSIAETKLLICAQKDLWDGYEDLENHLQNFIMRDPPFRETPMSSRETQMMDSGIRRRCSRSNSARALRSLQGPLADDSSLYSLENSDGGAYGLQTSVMSSISSRSSRQTHLMDMTNQRLLGTSLYSRASSTPLPTNQRAVSPTLSSCSSYRGGTPPPRNGLEASISYISKNEFNNLPQYMRGRITYDEINALIDKYNEVLNKKLAISKKGKTSKTKSDMDLLIRWKEQSTPELKGEYFVNVEDFASLSDYKLSKKDFNILTILRHVKKIREVRNRKIIFYVAVF